jgi:hypothetical protein
VSTKYVLLLKWKAYFGAASKINHADFVLFLKTCSYSVLLGESKTEANPGMTATKIIILS